MPRPAKPNPVLSVCIAPIGSLKEDERNARSHPDANLSAIRASLDRFGVVEPLVVRKGTGVVIGGNGRLRVMREMGMTECPVVEFEGTDSQCRALGLALNRTGELAGWNDLILADTLRSLQSEDFDLSAVGYQDDEVDRLIEGLARDATQPNGDVADGDRDGTVNPVADDGGVPPDPARLYPLAILLTRPQLRAWEDIKAGMGIGDDTKAFVETCLS